MKRSLIAAAFASALASAASAQTLEWKFNNSYAPTRAESGHVRDFAADVKRLSGGAFSVNVLEGGAMNLRDAVALRWMQQGTPEMGFIWPPFIGRDAPDLASLYVYGSVSSAEEHLKALPELKKILTEGMARWNIEAIGFMGLTILDASIFCRQPVSTLDQLRRVKLRVGSREQVETFAALGVAAQIVPQQELYSAMQTGVVDCALYPARILHTISLQEVAKHASYSGFPFPPVPYVMMAHQAKWKALPAQHRKSVADAIELLEKRSFDFTKDAQEEKEARARLASQGVTWHPDFSAADQGAIREAALKTWDKIAAEAGKTGPEYRQRILKALGR